MIEQARLLVLKAAYMMDTVGNKVARAEIAMIKVAVPKMLTSVVDMAIQAHGGAGVSGDFGLAKTYALARSLRLFDGPDEVHRNQIGALELPSTTRASHLQLGHEPGRALTRQAAHLAREMGLVGITRLARQHGERRAGRRQQAQEALEAQDPLQGLGAVAEGFVAMATQGAFAPAELGNQFADDAVGRPPFFAHRRNGRFDDRIGGRHPGSRAINACSSSIAAAAALDACASLSDSASTVRRSQTSSSGWCRFTSSVAGTPSQRLATPGWKRTPASLAAQGIVRVTTSVFGPAICSPPPVQ